MMYQRCPVCNGTGLDHTTGWTSDAVCRICDGKKIIHTVTGRPPKNTKMTLNKNPKPCPFCGASFDKQNIKNHYIGEVFDDGYRYCTHEDGPKYCQEEECPIKVDAYKFKRVNKKWHIDYTTGDKKS
jgi:hypothetical protein